MRGQAVQLQERRLEPRVRPLRDVFTQKGLRGNNVTNVTSDSVTIFVVLCFTDLY